MLLPEVVVHADWGKHPHKRWMVVAERDGVAFRIGAAEPTSRLPDLIASARSGRRTTLMGFDFPIGVPAFYGRQTGLDDFPAFLGALRRSEWESFFELASAEAEISVRRPFYPRSNGGRRQLHLTNALGAPGINDLRRLCEMPTSQGRRAACPLFWTLGANQVGRGALTGWREVVLRYCHAGSDVGLLPFDGEIDTLLATKSAVFCETYPAEAYRGLGIVFRRGDSKGRQVTRANFAPALIASAARLGVKLGGDSIVEIEGGFGDRPDGEDRFDALVGLLGMIGVLRRGSYLAPGIPEVRTWEGWIFGQDSEAAIQNG